ncbi:MAG: ABC transporter ATP-binding protein [Chloroflexi bacterium]|nr:ABC transporter ATP-binding protein [Chloroflexota bacterium]
MDSNPVVQTEGLTKRYGSILAVDDLSLTVPRGHVFGLLGPNGSGKTTTMGMLLGLTRPTAGSFSLFGEQGNNLDALRRVGAIVETPTFYPYLTGRQNLAYFQGILGRGTASELDDLLEQVRLADRADDRFHTYSLGMKQRLGLAYALLGDPELLFLDEPTNGMDPAGMAEMRGLIRSLGTKDRTVFLSSHLLNEVEQVCDSVVILSKGKLIAQGSVDELLKGRGQVRLRTTDNAQAVAVLAALEWVDDVKTENGTVVVTAPSERAAELSAALSRAEIYVTELSSGKESLESYFLEITAAEEGEEAR